MILVLFFLLLFAGSAEAVTRYVDPACTNAIATYNPTASAGSRCTGGSATSYSTIANGVAWVTAGNTLHIRGGTYNEVINDGSQTVNSGTSGNPVTVAAYPGNCETPGTFGPGGGCETVTMTGSTVDAVIFLGSGGPNGTSYWVVDGITIDGTNAQNGIEPGNNSVFKNFNICCNGLNVPGVGFKSGNGILVGDGTFSNLFYNGVIHDLSTGQGATVNLRSVGFYWKGPNSVADRMLIYNIPGNGIQMYPGVNSHGNILRNSVFHDTNTVAIGEGGGITVYGSDNIIHNNVFYNGQNAGAAIGIGPNGIAYNNTIYNYEYGFNGSGGLNAVIKNNILYQNRTSDIHTGNGLGDSTFAANLCTSAGTGCAITGNPLFVSPTTGDFHLSPGSVAIDAGTSTITGSISISSFNGKAPDIGALESGGIGPTCPSVPNALVASYGFEGNGNDSSGVNTATLGSGWSYTTGKYGQGAISTGASGITVADADALDVCNGFTYEAWVSIPNTSGDYALINKNPNSSSYLFASFNGYCGSGVSVGGYDTGTTSATACYATPLSTGFQHLAVTYDATLLSANVKLYLNGNQVTTIDGTALLSPTTGTLQFCTSGFGETCPSGTIIDEVRIYNYARSGPQIVTDRDTAVIAPALTPPTLKVSGIMKFGASAVALKLTQ